MSAIKHLIINSAYEEPQKHWSYDSTTQTFYEVQGRRPSGYVVAGENNEEKFFQLELVNKIRPRVKAWRENDFVGVTSITRTLLKHWKNETARLNPFFFCQLDAIETLIFLTEAPATEKVGLDIPNDGGTFQRICTKMCTGSGKTIVMAMLIAWTICNKVTYPQDKRFSKNILVVAPSLTVKNRLQVLLPSGNENYYSAFGIVPRDMTTKLFQGKILILNWQAMLWETEEALRKKKSVDKRGEKSDEAYVREILGQMSRSKNLFVINDEAHHAWRKDPAKKVNLTGQDKNDYKESEAQATVWISGLDRINRVRRIICCYDFSATPFAPSGRKNERELLFDWIVSDFGLNDGIESGLVKTPRIVIRDDAAVAIKINNTYRSKLYHIYNDPTVKDNINRAAEPSEALPDLISNAYLLLGKDWKVTFDSWQEKNIPTPPVMITVANRTETAARIKNFFDKGNLLIHELCEEKFTLRIDSQILKTSSAEEARNLREIADTIGKKDKLGEKIRNVISVGMLSEGWDAKTVTHILGLRAFSSQLLCEQVVGRGLRRTSYDKDLAGKFKPEYVNIFGIPFSFLPYEGESETIPSPTPPKTRIEPLLERKNFEITFPDIIRIEKILKPQLVLDFSKVPNLVIRADEARIKAELASTVEGKTNLRDCTEIDLEKMNSEFRLQSIIFKTAGQTFDNVRRAWQKSFTKYALLGQIIRLIEKYLRSEKIIIEPILFETNPLRRRIMYIMNMDRIVRHIWDYLYCDDNVEKTSIIYNPLKKIRSTEDAEIWFTSRPCMPTQKSQISHVVFDSAWEDTESYCLEKNPHVLAWVKNDHLDFKIFYVFKGIVHKYFPDFLIKLDNGTTLVLEVKGRETEEDKIKSVALREWIRAINDVKEFGHWVSDISYSPKDVDGIIEKFL